MRQLGKQDWLDTLQDLAINYSTSTGMPHLVHDIKTYGPDEPSFFDLPTSTELQSVEFSWTGERVKWIADTLKRVQDIPSLGYITLLLNLPFIGDEFRGEWGELDELLETLSGRRPEIEVRACSSTNVRNLFPKGVQKNYFVTN